jgi:hypothetical protein
LYADSQVAIAVLVEAADHARFLVTRLYGLSFRLVVTL